MADNKLNYQQARQVRKSRFSDMFLDQLAQKDTGVLGAVGKTISLRSQARIKGIKEKFDPLNIVKFMTMGSRFGPALFGKLTGRNQKDIDYFTGRTKSVVGTRNTADKLKKVGGDGDSEGINQQLSKIFSFLKNSRDEDVRLKQLAKNFDEELSMEKEKRHKELINTLQKLMKQINSGSSTAEPVKENSFLDDMWKKLKGLADIIGLMKNTLIELAKKIGMKVARALSSAGQWGLRALGTAAASGGLTVAGVAVGGAAITYGAANVLSNMTNEQRDQITADVGSDTALAAQALNSAKTKEELVTYEKSLGKYRKYMDDAPFLTRAAALYSPSAAGDYLRNVAKIPKSDLDEFEKYGIIPSGPKAEPVKKKQETVPQVPTNTQSGGTTPNQRPTMQNDPRLNTPSSATPSAPAPVSSPVSSLTNNNLDLNLTNTNSSTASKSVVSNTTNVSNKQQGSGLKPNQISVRNDEPTFMRLIQEATRLV
jgi:hypothetical protein